MLKIGLAQMDIVWEDKEKNQIKCIEMIRQAKEKGTELLIFPELTLTGFSVESEEIAEDYENSPTLDFFRSQAAENKIAIAFGAAFYKGNKLVNQCILVDESGKIMLCYDKIHPFTYGKEGTLYTGGDKIEVCEYKGVKLAAFICYDLRFPEIFQACAGCHLIFVIANWPRERKDHWVSLLKARAIENQCTIAGVNRIGTSDGLTYTGDSLVFDPEGRIIADGEDKEGVLTAEIYPDKTESYWNSFPMRKDRKEELYCRFYEQSIQQKLNEK